VNRDAFLRTVRQAVGDRRLADPGSGSASRRLPTSEDLVAVFRANLEALSGVVHEPTGPEAAALIVAELVNATGAESFLSWDADWIAVPGLLDSLTAIGLERQPDVVPRDGAGRRDHQLGYFGCAVGITGASAGLAETGSVIVPSGPGRPRMASLIAETHIALLSRDRLWPSLADWIEDHPDSLAAVTNLTVVTGPSRTADIEMVITRGVHGPREVHVVLV
jgi:L-lactate dehydrogenase complex protein LldG